MLLSWNPCRKTPDPDPSVDDRPTAAPSASTAETWVVPVGLKPVAAPGLGPAPPYPCDAVPRRERRGKRARVLDRARPVLGTLVQLAEPGLHDRPAERGRGCRENRRAGEVARERLSLLDGVGEQVLGEVGQEDRQRLGPRLPEEPQGREQLAGVDVTR
jgi:hypothetical protein